jgi:hypothetical protein
MEVLAGTYSTIYGCRLSMSSSNQQPTCYGTNIRSHNHTVPRGNTTIHQYVVTHTAIHQHKLIIIAERSEESKVVLVLQDASVFVSSLSSSSLCSHSSCFDRRQRTLQLLLMFDCSFVVNLDHYYFLIGTGTLVSTCTSITVSVMPLVCSHE